MKSKAQETMDWNTVFQPMMDIAEINQKVAQKCAELQSEYLTYLLDANIKQLQALANGQDPQSTLERQLEIMRGLSSKWTDTTNQEFATVRDAQQHINDALEKNYARNASFLKQFNPPQPQH